MLRKDGYLQPVLLQALGVVMLISFVVVWVTTGKQSSLLVGAALILIGMGSASGAIVSVRQEIVKPPQQDAEGGKPDEIAGEITPGGPYERPRP